MMKAIACMVICVLCILTTSANDDRHMYWSPLGNDSEAFDSMMEQAAFLDVPRSDLYRVVGNQREFSRSSDAREARARESYWKGWVLAPRDSEQAMTLVKESLELCDSARYPYDHARFSILLADLLRYSGNYADAYFIYRDKMGRLEKVGDDFWTAKVLVAIGAIMQELGEYHEALRSYREADRLFSKIGSNVCETKNRINLGNINYLLGDREKGLEYLNDLERSKYVANDSVFIANVLVSRFEISDYLDTDAAMRAFQLSRRIGNERLSVITLMSVGTLFHNGGDDRKAVDYLRAALDKTDRLGDLSNRKRALELVSSCYERLGVNDSAEICKREGLLLNDSLYRRENVENLKRAEHLATINQYERQIEAESEKHRIRQTLVVSVCVFLCVILVLSIILLLSSKRKAEIDRNLKEEKNQRLMLLNRQYSMEIEAKAKELASNTVLLAQKNARLKELDEQIRNMEQEGGIAAPERIQLCDTIRKDLSADDDWRFFKLRFDKVHPVFFVSLKDLCPALSKTELRLCAYIRVGMSAKEIAQVLSVRPETVNTSRYRIRKKMALDASDSLEAILERL